MLGMKFWYAAFKQPPSFIRPEEIENWTLEFLVDRCVWRTVISTIVREHNSLFRAYLDIISRFALLRFRSNSLFVETHDFRLLIVFQRRSLSRRSFAVGYPKRIRWVSSSHIMALQECNPKISVFAVSRRALVCCYQTPLVQLRKHIIYKHKIKYANIII